RGYYQGSNVSYNLKKLVEAGYMHHQKCAVDRRAVRVRLTAKGRDVRQMVAELFARHANTLREKNIVSPSQLEDHNNVMRRIERFWTEQIRFIY
ncbi:MarR family winged helix-turn-helix transcriptional regulator, partial [Abyssibius alkaniclasticus]